MPARKIPLVWSNPKAKDQIYSRYDPASKRIVQIGCCVCTNARASPFTLTSWNLVGSETFNIEAIWTPSAGAVSYTVNLLLSNTHPVTQGSSVLLTYPNVSSGDLLPINLDAITPCTYFGLQIIAFNHCGTPTYSNIIDGASTNAYSLYGSVPPVTASLSFDASNITIGFPDGYNVLQYNVYLYDVTAGDSALTQAIIGNISQNTSPFVIPYATIVPYAVSSPPLITGHQYKLIIDVVSPGNCTANKNYPPVTFTETFPTPPVPDSIYLQYPSNGTFMYTLPTIPDIYKWTLDYEIQNAGQGGGGGGTSSLLLSGGGGGAGASGPIVTGTYSLPYGAGGLIEVIIAPFGFGGSPASNGLPPLFDATLKIDAGLIATSSTPFVGNAGQFGTGNPVPGFSSGNGGTGGTGGIPGINIGTPGQQGGIGHANITITAGL